MSLLFASNRFEVAVEKLCSLCRFNRRRKLWRLWNWYSSTNSSSPRYLCVCRGRFASQHVSFTVHLI